MSQNLLVVVFQVTPYNRRTCQAQWCVGQQQPLEASALAFIATLALYSLSAHSVGPARFSSIHPWLKHPLGSAAPSSTPRASGPPPPVWFSTHSTRSPVGCSEALPLRAQNWGLRRGVRTRGGSAAAKRWSKRLFASPTVVGPAFKMSATIMETLSSNKGLGFAYPTTVGFQLRNAFPLADPGHPPIEALGHLGVSAALPLIATSKRSAVQPPATPPALALAAQPVRSPSVSSARAADVGWQGLLEISRTSGASGVLGCSTAVDEQSGKDTKIEICCTAHTNNNVRRLVKSVIRGLKACQEPEKALEGMGGTYFFVNEDGRKVAIMKPCDEEPLAPNNPKGYVGRSLGEPGWKPTVRVGEAAMREVAAYLLDRDGWARVPTSVLVRARHPIFCYNNRMSSVRQSTLDLPALAQANAMASIDASAEATTPGSLPMKLGSLQEFVNHKCDTSEMGPSRFSVSDVHRIGILDVRLFNTDRHAGNMLVRVVRPPTGSSSKTPASLMSETQYELVPIDHGFCLPETLEACYFEWLHWPQAMLPFSEEELKYIKEINVEADKDMLRKELPNLRPECLRVMELATTLLQRGAEAGLTLFDIASIMTRPFENGEEEPSELERTAAAAKQALENDDDDCDDVIEEGDSEEGDCSSSAEEVDDSDCDAAFGVYTGDAELEQTLQALEARARSGLLTQTSSRAEDSMLFDLDDYINGAPATPKPTSARSPGAASLGSSLSSADDFSFDMNTTSLLASSGTPVASGSAMQLCTPQASSKAVAGASGSYMASSVCVTGGGFLWRRAHRRSAVKRTAPKHSRSKPLARSPAPYPPPVVAFAPDSLNGLFRDMDEVEWQRFMGTWEGAVDAALRSGRWKKGLASNGPVAQSCPRF